MELAHIKAEKGLVWAEKYQNGLVVLGIMHLAKYFDELFRISKNQIIWGGNFFDLPPTRCFLIWDKGAAY
jgi:site-specific DNA-methyltransferase (adenine-specific)